MKNLFKLTLLVLAILLPSTATAYDFEVDGIYYNITSSNTVEVTSIPDNCYSGNVSIPETAIYNSTTYSVSSIGFEAFHECSGLTSVTIPNSVITIGESAFAACSITSIDIPNSVKIIGNGAFIDCDKLTSVTIGDHVTEIGDGAFIDCNKLTSVTIGDHVTKIGDGAFFQCSSLARIAIPNSVTTIGNSAFQNCFEMASVTFGDSVTSIGEIAFNCCTSLTNISIPNTVTVIGYGAFSDCSNLDEVYSYIYDLNSIMMGNYVFERITENYSGRTLHVPYGSSESYQADSGWSDYFSSIVEMDPVPVESIQLNVTTAGLNEGATLQLTAMVQPEEGTSKKMNWASSNPSIATVDDNGLVTTHSVGTATITAMTTDGSNLSASCTVTLLPVGLKGDVNEDGRLNISDVSDLIDMLLSN